MPSVGSSQIHMLLPRHSVQELVKLKRTALLSRVKAKTFPAPVRLSTRCNRWRLRDVLEWLESQQPAAV